MKVPFSILHGEVDKLCNVEGSRQLFEKASVKDKEIKVFPGARHHLYREPLAVREEAMTDTVRWISKRIP
jgi:alpha-beta hydrolase superfamily lysophospholipase